MEQQEHKRRVRYRGTHPTKYSEKYKELQPEKYADEIEHIKRSGRTPAGMHIPICVNEILEILRVRPGEVGYDATLGYGGHSERLLERLGGEGHLYATDVDPIESEKTVRRLAALGYGPEIFTLRNMNFARVDEVAPGVKFDFALADLGVSSMQIDNPERGFSFKHDGPLDLRLDPTHGETAAERLRKLSREELESIFVENSDEPYAHEIASAISSRLKAGEEIATTGKLAAVIERALNFVPAKERDGTVKKSCQRVFQALRIEVNSEFEVLCEFLEKLPDVMNSGGRIAVLTFHSGEDRMVKKAFKQFYADGVFSDIARDVIRPSAEECYNNPRARSTKLRWAIKA